MGMPGLHVTHQSERGHKGCGFLKQFTLPEDRVYPAWRRDGVGKDLKYRMPPIR